MAFWSSEPSPGEQVSEGDVIAIEITADDRSTSEAIATGIMEVLLATDTGQQIDGWEFDFPPVACDKDRLRRVVRLEYQVPPSPPDLVQLVATVRDYAGHEVKVDASYPTVGLWTGYMDVIGGNTIDTTATSWRCTTPWDFRVVLFAPASGDVYGYAEGVPGTQQCTIPVDAYPQLTRLGVTGTLTPDNLTLRFQYQSGGWYGLSLLYLPPAYELVLTRNGKLAYSDISLSHTEVGDYTDTHDLNGRIDLGCDACPSSPVRNSPRTGLSRAGVSATHGVAQGTTGGQNLRLRHVTSPPVKLPDAVRGIVASGATLRASVSRLRAPVR
jgi:hypothetical protein